MMVASATQVANSGSRQIVNDSIGGRFDPGRRQPGDPWGDRRRFPREDGFAPHDAIATYPDMRTARAAVQALQMGGIDASQISLFGPAADEAAGDLDVRDADVRFAGTMWRRSWIGGLVGLLAGALVGALIAGVVLRDAWPDAAGVFWAAVAGTAVLGLGTGMATGATSAAQMSRAWELTFHTVAAGDVGVAVHSADAAEARRATRVLARHRPTQLESFHTGGVSGVEGPGSGRPPG